ncbi:MAG TPA: TetR/AcrR family transcriptional regulator [Thermoanaerobaculaceae bacterium]|nr:TetR/AcrR family transcriptional regulator [Thermoanaerobaculaceae bacterium]
MHDHLAREEAIVTAAIDLAEAHGVVGVTTAALARRLEFTEAALYRYFPGKSAIIAAALRHQSERLFATMLLELMPEAVKHGQGVRDQLERHLRRFTNHNGLLAELLVSAAGGRDETLQAAGAEVLRDYSQRIAEYFERLGGLGLAVTGVAPSELARLWICQLFGGFVRCRLAREGWDPIDQDGFRAFVAQLRLSPAPARN